MGQRLVLHIGAMKTGTSFLQSVLNSHGERLEESGVRYLGGKFGVQSRAVRDLLELPKQPKRNTRGWRRLVKELRSHPEHDGLVSMEFLSFARPQHVEALMAPLAGIDVDVVLTVRDMQRVLPAQWQTYTRNFGTDSWSDYQAHVRSRRPGLGQRSRAKRTFERAQNLERILDTWGAVVPEGRLTVVTVPAPDAPRDLLWRRFAEAAELPDIELSLDGVRDNASVGYGSCDALRRLNLHLQQVRPRPYRRVMRPLINDVLAPLRALETRPVLDRRTAEFAAERNADNQALIAGRHRVIGTFDELPTTLEQGAPRQSADPDEEEVRRAFGALMAAQGAAAVAGDLDEVAAAVARVMVEGHGWG